MAAPRTGTTRRSPHPGAALARRPAQRGGTVVTVDGADTRPGATRIGRAARYGLLIGPSLSMLDSSIVNVAVPDIAQDLRAGLDTVHWVVSGYLLSLAVGLALTAYASHRFGTMRVYLVSMALFVATSAVCAVAPSIELLVTARVVQGFVGAPLVPLALSILMGKDGLSGGKVPVSAAVVLFLAPALGPSLGGLLIGAGGWRWVFLVNVPVGAAGLLLALRLRHLGTRARAEARFDPIGFLLLSAGLVTTLLGATRGSASGWGSPAPLSLVVAGIGLLAAYVRTASRRKDPPVRLDVIRSSQSLLALVLQVLASVIAFGTVFLIPVFTQQVQGHTALATGLALIPQGIVMGLGTALGQRISTHIPLRTLVTLGFAALAASSGVMLLLTDDTPLWVTAIMLCGRALAAGFVTTPLLAAFLAPLGENDLADGNTLYNITQRLGGAVGVGILGSMVATGAHSGAALAAFHQVGAVLVALALAAAVLARSLTRA
ncbi:DHA2 family efflux MFS transporter permease subunit [Oerskovia sp. USHLN155]|uniref:DHA2 family efflux MFS transporter permease subunit n=1 Tax=Oerskovia sp. USHLN155 TaxID=3081288 RepID=UPI003015E3AF